MASNLAKWLFTLRAGQGTLATMAAGPERLVSTILVAAAGFLLLGLVLPMVHITNFMIFEDQFSVATFIVGSLGQGQWLPGLAALAFTVVFPMVKIGAADYAWRACDARAKGTRKTIQRLEKLGRWSMMDVFVVGVVVFTAKSTVFAEATAGVGLYLFALAFVLSSIAVHLIGRTLNRVVDQA